MAEQNKTYWQGVEVLDSTAEFQKHRHDEFAEELPLEEVLSDTVSSSLRSDRRSFLKMFGFGISAAALAACQDSPVKKAIPYLVKPETITPGVANYFASTCAGCSSGCGVLVKVRDGRPIKIEGNGLNFNGESTCAVGQATVLSLYDQSRLDSPQIKGQKSTWEVLDARVKEELSAYKSGGKVRIVTGTITSPSTRSALAQFTAQYADAKVVSYDAVSAHGILAANQAAFGYYAIPTYNFDKAKVIVGINCDFLGTWISPAEHATAYSKGRKLDDGQKSISKHYQIESLLSLTGSNADVRVPIKPAQEAGFLVALHNEVARRVGGTVYQSVEDPTPGKMATKIASDLVAHKGNCLVVTGTNDVHLQQITNGINHLLSNYGNTLDIRKNSIQKQGNDAEMNALVEELKSGQVNALILYNVNPVYDHPQGKAIGDAISKIKTSIAFNDRLDETASLVTYVAPDHHYLESWNDTEAKRGYYSLSQPTTPPLFKTRQAQESILLWSGDSRPFYDYIREHWRNNAYIYYQESMSFDKFWNQTLHDGVLVFNPLTEKEIAEPLLINVDWMSTFSAIAGKPANNDVQAILYEKIGIRDGSLANNPWLQEFPDPISKATWDNYATLSPKFAEDQQLKQGDVVKISGSGTSITLPVLIQPGQSYGVVGIALGYGRTKSGKTADGVGQNAYPLAIAAKGSVSYSLPIKLEKVEGNYPLAQTQTHHYFEGRGSIIRETTLKSWKENPASGNPEVSLWTKDGNQAPESINLWSRYDYSKGYHWGMVIDLNACTGCGACIVACQAENNVAVVGKDQVMRRREMHWIRIDRYYSFEDAEGKTVNKEKEIEKGKVENFENVRVVFQPMLCQHCDNAPCESVCPVLATVHSSEGLNQQAYNRCIGTRYCANNCPYKVRRFNWFDFAENEKYDYTMYNSLSRMVLNPDVTVRSRGVMEKCSFCVQKIQEAKLTGKKEGRVLKDGDVKTACQKVCPSNAIHFGDKNDPESKVAKLLNNERRYQVLEEVKTLPNVNYLVKVRNIEEVKA